MPSPLLQSGVHHTHCDLFHLSSHFAEFFVPLDRACEVLEVVSNVAKKWPGWIFSESEIGSKYEHHPLVYHCEVRVGKCTFEFKRKNVLENVLSVGKDCIARGMNPFSDRDTCCIHFTWGSLENLPEIQPLISSLEAALRPFSPRAHYGKLVSDSFESAVLAASLPNNSLDE
jgi:hypothetical protein